MIDGVRWITKREKVLFYTQHTDLSKCNIISNVKKLIYNCIVGAVIVIEEEIHQ